MTFYERRPQGGRLRGRHRTALEAILASPQFLFRLEAGAADGARPAQPIARRSRAGLAAVVLPLGHGAGRRAAEGWPRRGGCSAPGALEKQVRRMLADPRSEALATRFAAQWLRLQDVEKILPDALLYPVLRSHARPTRSKRETELFFDSLVREDRSVLDLLTADYTFVNERIARALRHPQRHRQRVPPRDGARRPPRHPRPRQHPDAHLGRRPHLAGDARQVGDGSAARLAAAAAAAQRAGARGDQGATPAARCCRCASAWRSTAGTRRARRATA